MSNVYEQMLLINKTALENKIANLVEEQLNNEYRAKEALEIIAKVIDFSVRIRLTQYGKEDPLAVVGGMSFPSIEEYQKLQRNLSAMEKEEGNSKGWDWKPRVSVEVLGLTEHASDEAKTLWAAQSKEQERQAQLEWKRQRLERARKQLLELQAEIAAAEANP